MFRLYDHVKIDDTCPVHAVRKNNKLINTILQNFIEKNVVYISTLNYDKIICASTIQMMLPLILHVHIDTSNGDTVTPRPYHFAEKTALQKLSNPYVSYAHLLIVNFLPCGERASVAKLPACKVLRFRYAIVINCDENSEHRRRLSHSLEKIPGTDCFALRLGRFLAGAEHGVAGSH